MQMRRPSSWSGFVLYLWLVTTNIPRVSAFFVGPVAARSGSSTTTTSIFSTHDDDAATSTSDSSWAQNKASALALLMGGLLLVGQPTASQAAQGDNNLFRPNPLTNPVLERIRIWEQAEADEVNYGGELERGEAGKMARNMEEYYPKLLVPILSMDQDIGHVQELLAMKYDSLGQRNEAWTQARKILSQPQYQTIAFKKIFNAFGDNIYYSDPDRANVYLAGGATPTAEQSMAYLQRNEILTNLQDLQAELDFLLKANPALDNTEETQEAIQLAKTAGKAMTKYLDVVAPKEVSKARELMTQ